MPVYEYGDKRMEIKKSDWQLFRERITEWQERYMEKLNQEYIRLLSADGDASEKFWKLEERIRQDKIKPGVCLELEKQNVAVDLANLILDGTITKEDLKGFSPELQEFVMMLAEHWKME